MPYKDTDEIETLVEPIHWDEKSFQYWRIADEPLPLTLTYMDKYKINCQSDSFWGASWTWEKLEESVEEQKIFQYSSLLFEHFPNVKHYLLHLFKLA